MITSLMVGRPSYGSCFASPSRLMHVIARERQNGNFAILRGPLCKATPFNTLPCSPCARSSPRRSSFDSSSNGGLGCLRSRYSELVREDFVAGEFHRRAPWVLRFLVYFLEASVELRYCAGPAKVWIFSSVSRKGFLGSCRFQVLQW
ncbi:hypothetical protein OPV22_016343 [Ensete ventricosum]|uniref:Uncharacterized protein n=1 Tax=Ensete ventricosum TaxID=4639 RepID=A0AAV8QZQ6_ENSVE|nr:hypothetical protein OPV22_016343 [Ensete ventricosum]